ncbi:MAG TPA: fructose-bisphosphatase class II family protein, partial [Stellaceae bacterium]|nr:fructose-bisphosphatase class II family protein [Stellaceae bacterium]
LEGTTLAAKAMGNALAVMAMAEPGTLLHAPHSYMDKIAIGAGYKEGLVDLDAEPGDNINALAKAKGVRPRDLKICILDRPRHEALIAKVRKTGAAVALINDSDIAGIVAITNVHTGIDMYLGVGGAPEGVLAAAALRCIGGQMQGRLLFRNDDERTRARRIGITDLDRKYKLLELAAGDVMFAATGVTNGTMLKGVRRFAGGAFTHSVVMRSKTGTVRYIEASHDFTRKQGLAPLDR